MTPRVRRGLALCAVVLATGGLVLYRAPAAAFHGDPLARRATGVLASGKNSAAFSGPGVRGMISLSHSRLLAGEPTSIYADVRLVADATHGTDEKRAPIAMAVVLDTSGSMSGAKITEARRSVLRLLEQMADDDEIALVRYSDTSELVQPLARVGSVRASLAAKVAELGAGGGTNIPAGLSHGLGALDASARGRVRRIVLVSDGLDGTRVQAEELARTSFSSGITVSSLGVGLDFDQSYMAGVAQTGHGNFAFVKDGAALASFLRRELEETAGTTIEGARVRLELPEGVRFVAASGADAVVTDGEVELVVGSLFAGDERRVIVELAGDGLRAASSPLYVEATASWTPVGGSPTSARARRLEMLATTSASDVERGKDGAVLASATSVIASRRQIEAAEAYARGDVARAAEIADKNEEALAAAISAAPAAAATSLAAQRSAYRGLAKGFADVAPDSEAGRAAAKEATAMDVANMQRSTF